MSRILFVCTSHDKLGDTDKATGAFLPEIAHPYEVFKNAGLQVDFVSTKGGKVPLDGLDESDEASKSFIDDLKNAILLESTKSPDQVDPANYNVIFFAGGHGVMWDFPNNETLARYAAEIYERGGIVSAVCHGPAGIVNVLLPSGKYLVDGKVVATFTNNEEEAVGRTQIVPFLLETKLREHGADVRTAPNFTKNVVVCERLITGQNPQSAKGVAEAIVTMLTS